jgi:hypothetical protein
MFSEWSPSVVSYATAPPALALREGCGHRHQSAMVERTRALAWQLKVRVQAEVSSWDELGRLGLKTFGFATSPGAQVSR